jgi:hypothetical protein
MEAIADEAFGVKRRTLLDELCSTELQAIHLQLAEQRRALESNADAIRAAQRRIGDATEQLEELGDVKGRFEALPEVVDRGGSQEFQAASRQRQFNEAEDQAICKAAESVEALRAGLSSLLGTSSMPNHASLQVEGSANSETVRLVEQSIAKAWARVEDQLNGAIETLDRALEDIQSTRASLDARHAEQEGVYLTQRQQNQEAALAVQARTAAERDVRQAAESAGRLEEERAALAKLHAERKTLKADYLLTRDKISQIRERVASELQAESGPKVRIRVQRNADVLEYQRQLMDALHGSKLKNQDDILRTLSRIRPEDLAQIIGDDDLQELDTHCAFGKERGRRILDSLRAGTSPLQLEVLPIDDAVSIELNVSTTTPENYKDASELSRGQKCTALLPILLARRDTPLIIDQPEDNLDNHFIYQTVVESIRRLKAQRQMIFITHNANIPVLGEAELVVVMNSDGRRGYIEKSGSVDQCRRQIIDLLEGGEEAFALRRRRYGA